MSARTTRKKGINVALLALSVLMFFATFNSASSNLKLLGTASLLLTLFISLAFYYIFLQVNMRVYKSHLYILITSLVFITWMMVGLLESHSSRGLISIFQFTSIISFLLFTSLIKWDSKKIITAKRLFISFVLFLPLFANSDFIGAYMILPLFFIFLHRKITFLNIVLIITCLYLINYAGMRAVFVLLIVSAVTYFIWNFISRTKFRFYTFFAGVVSILISFILVYPKIIYWSKFPEIDAFIVTHTGKRIMSGRQIIWEFLMAEINKKPFLGHGTGTLPSDVINTTFSSHNLYLQVALQNGWIGLLILLTLFFFIWVTYYKTKNVYGTRLSASFFIGILAYQSFEVVLTQNKLDNALVMWLIISVGISNSIYLHKEGNT